MKKNLVYTPITLPNFNLSAMLDQLESNTKLRWSKQTDRGSRFLPIFGWHYRSKTHSLFNFRDDIELQSYIAFILDICSPPPDIHILHTPPYGRLPIHVDCSNLNAIRKIPILKIRTVLQGEPETLFFIDNNSPNRKIKISNKHESYIINGSAAHGMNNTNVNKYVIAIGWPWKGKGDKFDKFLKENLTRYSNDVLTFDNIDNNTTESNMLNTMRYEYDKN